MKIRVENPKRKQFKKLIKHFLFFSFLVATLITVTNCEKEPDEFGSDMMPGRDSVGVEYDESFNLQTYQVSADTFVTSLFSNPLLLGSTSDPYYGQANVSFAMQIAPAIKNPDFPENAVVDSAKFVFIIDSLYGFKNKDLDIRVFKLNRDLQPNYYYSNANPDNFYSSSDLISVGSKNISDSIYEVKLSPDFGHYLLSLDSVSLSNDTSFINTFPGIYCEAKEMYEPGGHICIGNQFLSHIKVHYHTPTDTLSFMFAYTQGLVKNIFPEQNLTSGISAPKNINTYLNNDPNTNDSLLFIKGLGGTRAKIKLPNNIDSILSNKLISKASLEFQHMYNYEFSPIDSTLLIHKYNEEGDYVGINARGYLENRTYKANITEYIQYLAKGRETNKTIYINTSNFNRLPGQTVLGGVTSSNPPKLKVKYYNNPPE
jgi:hypothetical protein